VIINEAQLPAPHRLIPMMSA